MGVASLVLSFAVEQSTGIMPMQGYTRIPDIRELAELDCYTDRLGLRKPLTYRAVYADELIDVWKRVVETYQKSIDENLAMWFCHSIFGAKIDRGVFFKGEPLRSLTVDTYVDCGCVDLLELYIRPTSGVVIGKAPRF